MTTDSQHPQLHTSPDECYSALLSRDARFDGSFFVGVSSTGIYCRPVCRVKTPKRENCSFFELAAQAEQAGYRPCLRCRPELAPGSLVWSTHDASRVLALQAAQLLDEPDAWHGANADALGVEALANRLGVSDRHLRRIFEAQFGISPVQYLQTRRLLTAKQLLADTDLPVAQVALVSGFGSVRRFNAAFGAHYGLAPTALRKQHPHARADAAVGGACTVQLGYRPPYDVAHLLGFLQQRALPGLEHVSLDASGTSGSVVRSVSLGSSADPRTGWIEATWRGDQPRVQLRVSESLLPVLPTVIRRARAWLDLDADPKSMGGVLDSDFPGQTGQRVPGCMDGFELAVRAVLGQQITVAAARTLAARLLARFGAAVDTPHAEVNRCFPSPAALAHAAGDALGELGIVKQRQAAIVALARAVDSGQLQLTPGVDVQATMRQLRELPGIGDWTAQYIAMRALRWPDAFPAGDVALHAKLGLDRSQSPTRLAREAEARSQAWKPWRSYAVIRTWAKPTH